MAKRTPLESSAAASAYSTLNPLSADELEAGLQTLNEGGTDPRAFWDDNIVAFRHTVLVAISETSEALSMKQLPRDWSAVLEGQLESLRECLALADRHLCSRTLN